MAEQISLLGRRTYKINDCITIVIPTVRMARGENIEEESAFWNEISLFTTSPDDMVVELTQMGIDFVKMSDYELFIFLFGIHKQDGGNSKFRNLLFKDLDFWGLDLGYKQDSKSNSDADGENQELVLLDGEQRVIIDESVYKKVSEILCLVTGHVKPPRKKFGTESAKKRWIETEQKKKKFAKMKAERKAKQGNVSGSGLDGIILRLVCNANFPYNFETVNDITLFDLIYSLKQIEKDISVSDLMQSRLVGADLRGKGELLSRFVL